MGENGPQSRFARQFPGKAGRALADFGQMLNYWIAAREELSVVQLMDAVIDRIEYQDFVNDGSEEGMERWGNVLELRGVAGDDPEMTLSAFLEQVTLVSDQDTIAEEGKAPTLLTLHAAKGLEYPVVFIVGLDEGILPHQRSFEDPEAMHEERRLFYVGMTRAKDRLYLLRAFRRSLYGDSSVGEASRFLDDIPEGLLSGNVARKQSKAEAYYKKATRWDANPPAQAMARYKSGQRVKHRLFGEGIVIDSRVSGGEEEVNVAFEDVGLKRLAASVANLEVLKG
jgi:DNA helicase-2/ATP-dependent DNA helicase PcrA